MSCGCEGVCAYCTIVSFIIRARNTHTRSQYSSPSKTDVKLLVSLLDMVENQSFYGPHMLLDSTETSRSL